MIFADILRNNILECKVKQLVQKTNPALLKIEDALLSLLFFLHIY